ncbi:MAG TPA: hypothetical protein VFB90_01855 [Dehalococcoidia bacterium]|nr:hypothetical protein [Dehalococcoidia bacterium]
MADRALVEQAAADIIAAVTAEFPGTTFELDFDTPRDDYEDAFLWLTPDDPDPENLNEVWAYAIKLVQDVYDEKDVYLVARVRGGVIIRERDYESE